MASEKRRVGLFGVAGILVAALIIAGFMFAGNFLVFGKGVLTIQVMDKPVDLENLWLTITALRIKGEDDSWTTLALKTDYFDLLELRDVSITLSETPISAGDYVMIEMDVQDALAVYGNSEDDDPLTVPGGMIRVILTPHLHMDSEGQVTVLIDLQPVDDLDTIGISHSLNLRPVVKAVVSQ